MQSQLPFHILCRAAQRGDLEAVKSCLINFIEWMDSNPGAIDESPYIYKALTASSMNGYTNIVKTLLDFTTYDIWEEGWGEGIEDGLPIIYAAEYGHLDTFRLLYEHGEIPCYYKNKLLNLLPKAKDLNTFSKSLHIASNAGHLNITKFLLDSGVID